MTDNENLPSSLRQIDFKDHMLNIMKAALATAPFAGGVASLMNDYIPSRRTERLERFAERIAADLERFQDQVDPKKFSTEQYAQIFETCFRKVSENFHAEKIELFRGILINAALDSSNEHEEREYFIQLIDNFSIIHVRMITFLAKPYDFLQRSGIDPSLIRGNFSQVFSVVLPGVNAEVVKSAFGDLYQIGFLNTDKSVFSTMTSSQGLDLVTDGGRVTDFGKRFIEFCTVPE